MSDFEVLLLFLTARSRRTRKADQKCPEKQDKKSKRDMKNKWTYNISMFDEIVYGRPLIEKLY